MTRLLNFGGGPIIPFNNVVRRKSFFRGFHSKSTAIANETAPGGAAVFCFA
jgi:hypothetical protein